MRKWYTNRPLLGVLAGSLLVIVSAVQYFASDRHGFNVAVERYQCKDYNGTIALLDRLSPESKTSQRGMYLRNSSRYGLALKSYGVERDDEAMSYLEAIPETFGDYADVKTLRSQIAARQTLREQKREALLVQQRESQRAAAAEEERQRQIVQTKERENANGQEQKASEHPTISQGFFGVNLGESRQAVSRKAPLSADVDRFHFKDEDHPGQLMTFTGAFNGNKAIQQTQLSIYKDKVYEIELVFADASRQNYDVLRSSLLKKYGSDKAGLFDAMETKACFTTTVDGQSVTITLNRDSAFNAEGGTLSISYQYDAIAKRVVEEMNRRKAAKVSGDL